MKRDVNVRWVTIEAASVRSPGLWSAVGFARSGRVVNVINGDNRAEVEAAARRHWPSAIQLPERPRAWRKRYLG